MKVCYGRNNHHGGLARLSLVPIAVMNNRTWHKRLTLSHNCFNTGRTYCKSGDCGTDRSKIILCHEVQIPRVFPDGDYVLGHVWYGGLHFKREHGHFQDYNSCAFVRISGGESDYCSHDKRRTEMQFHPHFSTGMTTDEKEEMDAKEHEMIEKGEIDSRRKMEIRFGKCLTSSTWVGRCRREGCEDVPSYYGAFKEESLIPYSCGDIVEAASTEGEDLNVLKGVCKAEACCPKECGFCGGPDCSRRVEGFECCSGAIQESGRYCDKHEPPCVRTSNMHSYKYFEEGEEDAGEDAGETSPETSPEVAEEDARETPPVTAPEVAEEHSREAPAGKVG